MQVVKQWYFTNAHLTTHTPAFWTNCSLQVVFKGRPCVECTAVVQTGGDQDMSDHKQGVAIQERAQLVQEMDLCKDPLGYRCYYLLCLQELKIQEDPKICLGFVWGSASPCRPKDRQSSKLRFHKPIANLFGLN